jgi:hypothetical protein
MAGVFSVRAFSIRGLPGREGAPEAADPLNAHELHLFRAKGRLALHPIVDGPLTSHGINNESTPRALKPSAGQLWEDG